MHCVCIKRKYYEQIGDRVTCLVNESIYFKYNQQCCGFHLGERGENLKIWVKEHTGRVEGAPCAKVVIPGQQQKNKKKKHNKGEGVLLFNV